jgi:exonuclease VII small subunit
MTTPRRRLIRPALVPAPVASTSARLQKLRERLEKEQVALARWVTKLRRSFHAFERCQRSVARIERQITQLET